MASREEYVGAGSLAQVGELLQHHGAERVFLVTGRSSYAGSGAEAGLAPLLAGKKVVRFNQFSPNPRSEDLERGVSLFRSEPFDVMLAVGGGSVLDMAKMIKVCAPSSGAASQYILGEAALLQRGVPLIAIPTTAGTGAEVTHFAVVYIDSVKHSLATHLMLPEHVILDHALTASLPVHQIAATGVDALAQAMEAYWSVNSTDESLAYSVEAITLIAPVLKGVVNDGTAAAREAMLKGANLAGKAINIARTTAPHALSYAFTSKFGVAHGHAVGLTLGAIFEHNAEVTAGDATDARGAEFSRDRMAELSTMVGAESAGGPRAWADSLMSDISLATRLRDLDVARSDLPELARTVNNERLANNPRQVSQDVIGRILESIY